MTPLAAAPSPRLPVTLKLLLLALLAAIALLAPRPARAEAARRGPYAEFGWRPALVTLQHGVMPAARTHFTLGVRLNPVVTVATQAHATLYFDRGHKPGAGLDLLLQFHVARGLYLRAGAGVLSNVPAARMTTERTPGYGGLVGLGYAFPVAKGKGVALGLGADYDLRILRDGRRRGILVVGLSLVFG